MQDFQGSETILYEATGGYCKLVQTHRILLNKQGALLHANRELLRRLGESQVGVQTVAEQPS